MTTTIPRQTRESYLPPSIGKMLAMLGVSLLLAATSPGTSGAQEGGAGASPAYQLQQAFIQVADRYKPLVVSITAKKQLEQGPGHEFFFGDPFEYFFGDPGQQRPGAPPGDGDRRRYYEGGGSGVLISPKGYILTNYHVISDAEDITVVQLDGEKEKRYDAKLIGKDPYTDLAVIKIDIDNGFPAAALGDSDDIQVGDFVLAIGSPFGLGQTVTAGIISAKRQSLVIEGKSYQNLLQTDAAINRGNSGGPLVNTRGEVVGINTAIYAPTGVFAGIGFAVPINRAKEILDELIRTGKVTRGWLGIEIREVDEAIARQFGLKEPRGVLVNSVGEGTPAAKAGLQRGDIIVSFAGKEVNDVAGLQGVVSRMSPGEKASMTVVRGGKTRKLSVTLGTMPEQPGLSPESEQQEGPEKQSVVEWQGLAVAGLSRELAARFDIDPSQKGVVVLRGNMGLVEGDLIKEINRKKIEDLADFREATSGIKPAEGIVFDVIRDGTPVYITYQGRR